MMGLFRKILLTSLLLLSILCIGIGAIQNKQLKTEERITSQQVVFPYNGSIPSATYPNKNCVGKFMYLEGCIPSTQYRLSFRYDLPSLALKANELGYHADISVIDAGRTWVPFYNELHRTNIPGTEGYVEHHVGYDLVVTKPDWVTIYIAVLRVIRKVADDEIYIIKLYNTSNVTPNRYQYISLDQYGRCDLSDWYIKNKFREMLDNIGIPSKWIDQVHFAENVICHLLN